jgi:hypothetical protein
MGLFAKKTEEMANLMKETEMSEEFLKRMEAWVKGRAILGNKCKPI